MSINMFKSEKFASTFLSRILVHQSPSDFIRTRSSVPIIDEPPAMGLPLSTEAIKPYAPENYE